MSLGVAGTSGFARFTSTATAVWPLKTSFDYRVMIRLQLGRIPLQTVRFFIPGT